MSVAAPVALVTGAASGIGRACALLLAEHGYALVLADLDEAGLAATAETAGVACERVAVDLARTEDVDRLVATCADRFARLDALLQIAGIGCYKPFWELRRDEIDRVLAVNIASLLELAGRCVPMLAEQRGTIVNMASVRAFRGGRELSAYAATKGAVISMTRSMAHELGPHGIRVNALCPGTIDTPLLDRYAVSAGDDPATFKPSLADEQPLGRIGTPEDVAGAALFLATPASEWITGTTLTVDGGLTA
jgi:NAD(P)-dependent dehydrogenase (short-subunit alcohol dehydrogenase family)